MRPLSSEWCYFKLHVKDVIALTHTHKQQQQQQQHARQVILDYKLEGVKPPSMNEHGHTVSQPELGGGAFYMSPSFSCIENDKVHLLHNSFNIYFIFLVKYLLILMLTNQVTCKTSGSLMMQFLLLLPSLFEFLSMISLSKSKATMPAKKLQCQLWQQGGIMNVLDQGW